MAELSEKQERVRQNIHTAMEAIMEKARRTKMTSDVQVKISTNQGGVRNFSISILQRFTGLESDFDTRL